MINWRKPLIYLLSFLQGSNRMNYYHSILKYSKMSNDELKSLQEKKLEKLLLHAYENVPYYNKVLKESGVINKGEVLLENYHKIPILTKDILRNNFEELKSKDIDRRKSFLNHSGGSTGEPTEFIQDKDYDDWNIANKMFYKKLGGQEIGWKELRIWGSERDFLGDKEKLSLRLRNWIYNRKDLNAFRMTEERMFEYLEVINTWKPTWIEGYVQPLYELALFAQKNNIKMHKPIGVLTSAGTLYPNMRQTLEELFECDVWNRYGSREVGDAAIGKDRLRLSVWNQYLEVISKKDSDLGKVIITTLNNYSMPLIRYDIGDIASASDEWGCLDRIEGRETSVFRTRDGKIVPGLLFIHFLGVVMNDGVIKRFQMIQKTYEDIEIRVVINDKDKFGVSKKDIEKLINDAMGYECNIEWIEVEDIKPLESGKYLYVKSEIKI